MNRNIFYALFVLTVIIYPSQGNALVNGHNYSVFKKQTKSNPPDVEMYERICRSYKVKRSVYKNRGKTGNKDWDELYVIYIKEVWTPHSDRMIKSFMEFIIKYPGSDLIPEAKLRIAEYFKMSFRPAKAKFWLNNIIELHKDDKYYSRKKHGLDGEWTAAWALFYRAKLSKNKEDFLRIIREYPKSKKVLFEIYLLKK